MVMLCEKFGWTYQELIAQPWWFAEIVKIQLRVDGEKHKRDMKKLEKH
ncbi:MAG: hypothetical protein KA052_00490 [Candidatus Pacebacteria bacterium]|nr:hypothetical protein [Candidatus Paceibacterota bacterium]